jgi:hypothetical protein
VTHVDALATASEGMQCEWCSGNSRTPEDAACVLGHPRAPFARAARRRALLRNSRRRRAEAKRLCVVERTTV